MDKNTDDLKVWRIGFLLIDGFAMMSYASASEPLRAANLLAGRKLYDVRHLPVSGANATSSNGAVIKADAQIGEHIDFDFLFVFAGGNPLQFDEARIFQWLRHLASRGVVLGGVSGGPVILAKAGVMKNRRMSVHWEHTRSLAMLYPELLLEQSLYVIDRDRLTCAGGTAPLDLMHALISSHQGAYFAREVSDWFMHTQIRPSSDVQRAGLVSRYGVTNLSVVQAIEIMNNHIADPLSLNQLSDQVNLSARQLNRLFKDKLGKSTMDFCRVLRLEKAHNFLVQTPLSTTQIALAAGFSSSAHFATAYKKHYGATPSSRRG